MLSQPRIPIPLTSRDAAGNPQVANKINDKDWCFLTKEHITIFQYEWLLSPQCINYVALTMFL